MNEFERALVRAGRAPPEVKGISILLSAIFAHGVCIAVRLLCSRTIADACRARCAVGGLAEWDLWPCRLGMCRVGRRGAWREGGKGRGVDDG